MHWFFWAFLICILFLVTYNPRSGRLGKFFVQDRLVEVNDQRTSQSNSDSGVPRE